MSDGVSKVGRSRRRRGKRMGTGTSNNTCAATGGEGLWGSVSLGSPIGLGNTEVGHWLELSHACLARGTWPRPGLRDDTAWVRVAVRRRAGLRVAAETQLGLGLRLVGLQMVGLRIFDGGFQECGERGEERRAEQSRAERSRGEGRAEDSRAE